LRRRVLLSAIPVLLAAGVAPLHHNVTSAAGVAPATARATGTASTDFYRAPSPLPFAAPGTVIRSRSTPVALGAGAPAVQASTVLYHSRTTSGRDVAVTGTVLTPKAAWTGSGARPVVGFAVGTQGPGPQCAPSKQIVAGTEYENSNINQALNKNWAVTVTDYEGYTTGNTPTYVTGRSEGHAVLDAVRAAQHLAGSGVSRTAPLLLWGYSQGGGASAWATVLQPSYAPDLHLLGDASGGVPADSRVVGESLNRNVGAAFLMYSLSGFAAAYPQQVPLYSHLNTNGQAAFAAIRTQCTTQSLGMYAGKDLSQYFKDMTVTQFGDIPSVRQVEDANTITTKPQLPKVPVFQYHGLADEIVPLGQARTLHATWCAKGVTTIFQGFTGEHLTTNAQAAPVAVQFLADRLSGRPVLGSCLT